MKAAARALVPALLLAALSAAGQTSEGERLLATQPPQRVERLRRERFVALPELEQADEDFAGMIQGLVLFARPRDEVLRMLIRSERQTEYRPELREARIVEERPDGQVVAYRMRLLLMSVEYRAIHGWDFARGEVWWSLDPAAHNDLSRLEGRWKVYALDDQSSVAHFGTRIDVGPSLPEGLQDLATRQKLPEAVRNLRLWIDSGGTYRP